MRTISDVDRALAQVSRVTLAQMSRVPWHKVPPRVSLSSLFLFSLLIIDSMERIAMADRYTAKEHEFLRSVCLFAEEDRHKFTSEKWRGGYRWFKSANVIPLEQWYCAQIESPRRKAG